MKTLKTILKLIGALIIGSIAGLLLSSVGLVMFTDSSFSDVFSSFSNVELGEMLMAVLFGIVSLSLLPISGPPVLLSLSYAGFLL